MKDTFKLYIHAESTEQGIVQCETKAEVACSEDMAVSVIVNLMKSNEDMRDIIHSAVFMCMADVPIIRKVSNKDDDNEPKLDD